MSRGRFLIRAKVSPTEIPGNGPDPAEDLNTPAAPVRAALRPK
jgi:hypothetical protein